MQMALSEPRLWPREKEKQDDALSASKSLRLTSDFPLQHHLQRVLGFRGLPVSFWPTSASGPGVGGGIAMLRSSLGSTLSSHFPLEETDSRGDSPSVPFSQGSQDGGEKTA